MICGFLYAIIMAAARRELKLLWYGVFAETLRLITRKKVAQAPTATLPPLETSVHEAGEGRASEDEAPAESSTMVWAYGPVMLFGLILGGIATWYV